MPRFHISPDGQPRPCTATKACRYGEDTPHFSTADDARTAYEASQAGSFSPARLNKKAYENDEEFTFEGVKFDSQVWLYSSGEGAWRDEPSITLVSDGREYRPMLSYGTWRAEVSRERVNEGDWVGMKGTRSFKTLEELVLHVEALARKRAMSVLKKDSLTPAEFKKHLRDEKVRYDALEQSKT